MAGHCRLAILSDIHFAGPAEKARGSGYELRGIHNPLLRVFVRLYRHFIWMREPLSQGGMLERFLAEPGPFDFGVANGDYTCNSDFIGVSDPAAAESLGECLDKLRRKFDGRLAVTYGDHELGKVSFFGGQGGMRLASWHCAREKFGLDPLWRVELGNYVLLGMVSSLVALPVFEPDTLPQERPEWEELRREHLAQIRNAFAGLRPEQRLLLFCHDPTALPFLLREEAVRAKLPQVEQTIIGHLHSRLVLWKSRWLAGMPRVTVLGHTATRLSTALRDARDWRPFNVRLCPSLAGIELLKDGGYLTADLDLGCEAAARFQFHRLAR